MEPLIKTECVNQGKERDEQDRDNDERYLSTTTLFSLIPDIWSETILPLLSKSDITSLMNASMHFRWMDPFTSKISTVLLPQALPILLRSNCDVSAKSLLCWRRVNKDTMAIVDSFLQEPNSAQAYYESLATRGAEWSPNVVDENHHLRSAVEQIRCRYDLQKRSYTLKFIEHHYPLESGREISVVTKSLCLSITDTWDGLGVNTYTSHILRQYGNTLTSVTFCTINYGGLIFKMLRLLPNIKILRMKGTIRLVIPNRVNPNFQLDSLDLLDVEDFNDKKDPLSPNLLQLCRPTLKTLICKGELLEKIRYNIAFILGLPSLRSLRLKDVQPGFPDLLFTLYPLPLEELQLLGNEGEFTLSDFCETINTFAKTLIGLKWFIPLQHTGTLRELTLCSQLKKLTKFSTEIGNLSDNWIWYFLRVKCPELTEFNLHGSDPIREATITMLKRKFNTLTKLQKITISSGFDSLATGMPERVVLLRDDTVKRSSFMKISSADITN